MIEGNLTMARFQTHLKQLVLEKSARVGYAISQRELAEATGISLPAISRWYRNDIDRLEAGTIEKLMKYFDCTLAQLVDVVPSEE